MQEPVSEATRMDLENAAYHLLTDPHAVTAPPIVTKKYVTHDNRLVYLTQCNVAESDVPNLRIQIFERIDGGVKETSYAIYTDHRLERTDNPMIFGATPGPVDGAAPSQIDETTARQLVELVKRLPNSVVRSRPPMGQAATPPEARHS